MSDGWDGILDQDEHVLWQGRPSGRVRVHWDNPMEVAILVFHLGFSVFWMVMASQAGGIFWMFGLIFFGNAIYQLAIKHYVKAYRMKDTHYTLTNKRAFIAKTLPTKTLDSYPITADTPLKLEEGRDQNIYFATKSQSGKTKKARLGFEQIDDARHVYGLMRDIQKDAA